MVHTRSRGAMKPLSSRTSRSRSRSSGSRGKDSPMERGASSTPGGRKGKGKAIKNEKGDATFDTIGYTMLAILIILTVVMYPHKVIKGAGLLLASCFTMDGSRR